MINNISVIIVDDHPVVRSGTKNFLEDFPGILVTGEACTGAELLQTIKENKFDVILLDINLPDKSGFEILEQLKIRNITTPVLLFSVYSEKEYAVRAFRAGAKGFIHKESKPDEIVRAIKKAASGGRYMSDTVQELLGDDVENRGKKSDFPHRELSDREYEVMLLIYNGLSNIQIGKKLNISDKTVSEYRSRINNKMGFSNIPDLVKYVIKHKLDPTEYHFV